MPENKTPAKTKEAAAKNAKPAKVKKAKKAKKPVSAKKLPALLKKSYTEKKFEKKILKKIYITDDKKFVASLFKTNEKGQLSVPKDALFQPEDFRRLKLIGKEKHGIIAEGFTAYSEEYWVDFKDCFLELEYSSGRLNPEGYDKYTCTLGAFAYQNYTRYTNHIVGLLDSWTVETRLLKDDVSVIDQMSGFTLAQILDFITQAASNHCPNVTAALLAYKNERFEDYGAVESLLLEE